MDNIFECVNKDRNELQASEEFKKTFKTLEENSHSFFVTGKAGTGKSTLLRYFVEHTKKKVVVLAPTGLAALNVGGQTIHSFFRFPPKAIELHHIKKLEDNTLYRELDAIVVDEVSMVRSDILDGMDRFMRKNGKFADKPFGGCQLILFGDLFQLAPVVNSSEAAISAGYASPYFFDANSLKKVRLEIVELETVYRHKEEEFVKLLDNIRLGNLDDGVLSAINARVKPGFDIQKEGAFITLAATNELANSINSRKLAEIPSNPFFYDAKIEGSFDKSGKNLPAEAALCLKVGAKVIFVRNDPGGQWVNGSIDTVHELEKNRITVKLDNGTFVGVDRATWDKVEYRLDPDKNKVTTESKGRFTQFPLKLAWALTIHKSQGQTFDKVFIDLSTGAFSHGQTYVALSRARTLDGIVLKSPIRKSDVIVDNAVLDFISGKQKNLSGYW